MSTEPGQLHVTLRLLARDPKDRYPDAAALIDDLQRVLRSLKDGDGRVVEQPASGGSGAEEDSVVAVTNPPSPVQVMGDDEGDSTVTITGDTGPPSTVEVPDLVGKSVLLASNTLENEGLTLGGQTEAPSYIRSEGLIIGQTPEAGTMVTAGSKVTITLSSGPPTVEVPTLAGKNTVQASSTLADAGLTLGEQKEVPSGTVPEGEIVGQTPEAGTRVEPDSLVSVTVSSGPREKTRTMDRFVPARMARTHSMPAYQATGKNGRYRRRRRWVVPILLLLLLTLLGSMAYAIAQELLVEEIEVPDLVGATSIEEARALASEDFSVEVEDDSVKSREPAGTIVDQSPRAGKMADWRSTIYVTISGTQMADLPNVEGEASEEALRLLEGGAGFGVEEETGESSAEDEGYVTEQDPRGGGSATAEAGSTVTITVGAVPDTVEDPYQVVQDFYDLAAEEDYSAAYELMTEDYRARTFFSLERFIGTFSTLESVTFVEGPTAEVSGGTATVAGTTIAEHTNRTQRNRGTWILVNEGDEWKIDNIAVQRIE